MDSGSISCIDGWCTQRDELLFLPIDEQRRLEGDSVAMGSHILG